MRSRTLPLRMRIGFVPFRRHMYTSLSLFLSTGTMLHRLCLSFLHTARATPALLRATSAAAASATATATTSTPATATAAFGATCATRTLWLLLAHALNGNLDGGTALQHHLDRILRHIDRNHFSGAARRFKKCPYLRHTLLCLNIVVILIRETTEQTSANARDFGGVQGQPLFLRHFDRDNAKIGNPGTTAQRFTAWPQPTLQFRLIASAYLAQLDTCAK